MHILYCTDNVNEKKDQHADTNKKTGNQNYKICRNGFDGDGKHCNDQADQHQFVFPVFFLSHIQTESQENQKEGDCKNHVGARQSFNKISSYSGDGMGLDSFINYNYFAVTTGELQKTHQPNDDIIVPVCQAVKDNYYVHENLYFDTWDADSIGNVYRAAYEQGDGFCSVRFADRELYEQAFTYFITDQKIVHYCKGLTSLYYLEDSDQNVLTIKF